MPLDYSGQNLRGHSFKGQNLTGANFSGADIRGANFSNAILKDAEFRGAKAGLQRRWVVGLLIVSWLLSALSGFLSITISKLLAYIFDTTNLEKIIGGTASLVTLAVFCIIAIRKGITAGLVVLTFAVAGAFAVAGSVALAKNESVSFGIVVAFAGSVCFTVAVAVAGAFTVAVALPSQSLLLYRRSRCWCLHRVAQSN